MKIYVYLTKLKNNENLEIMAMLNENEYNSETPTVYAITNDKKMAKLFKRTRRMDKFREKIIHVEDKKEWLEFANKYRSTVLTFYELNTKDFSSKVGQTQIVKTPMTDYEYQTLMGMVDEYSPSTFYFLSEDWWSGVVPLKFIKDKDIRHILEDLNYEQMRNFWLNLRDDYSATDFDIAIDELLLFKELYKDLLLI